METSLGFINGRMRTREANFTLESKAQKFGLANNKPLMP
jgi:hypothetical protein